MTFDTDWDVEKYKSPFESDEHWQLRRAFLLAHKNKYPEDQLICLAQVFFNVEFLGCRYPEETMQLVTELSEGIADSFREKKQCKIQRTFVKASDAAGAKIKGLSNVNTCNSSDSQRNNSTITSSTPITQQSVDSNSNSSPSVTESSTSPVPDSENTTKTKNENADLVDNNPGIVYSSNPVNLRKRYPEIADVIIFKKVEENFFDHGASILHGSLSRNQISTQYEFKRRGKKLNDKWECNVIVQNQTLCRSLASNKQLAKKAAVQSLLDSMQQICYTLEEKVKFLTDGSTIDRNLAQELQTTKLDDNSVANKMMKMMGWKGGGLGKTEQGISEPVAVQERVQRSGLGTNLTEVQVIKKIRQKLKTYAESETDYDLLFSHDFTKEERSKLHAIAQAFHLKSRSYGSGADRHLVVSKKNKNKDTVIENLKNCGGENERYRLIEPTKPSSSTTLTS